MKQAFILFVIGAFLLITAVIIIQSESPFQIDKIQSLASEKQISKDDFTTLNQMVKDLVNSPEIFNYLSRNAYLVIVIVFLSIFFLLSSLHIVIDKLFFKKTFESPTIHVALIRGFYFAIFVLLIFILKLYKVETIIYVILTFSIIIIEILSGQIVNFLIQRAKRLKDESIEGETIYKSEFEEIIQQELKDDSESTDQI